MNLPIILEWIMTDSIYLAIGQGIRADSGTWYKHIQTLGLGGNAATFLVVATSGRFKGILFAAKVFRRLSKPERRASFLEEVRFLKTCEHPGIMRVFDDGVLYDKFPFVVAEYLPSTLRTILRAGSASTPLKISIALQLLSALNYLATLPSPVIHRDIKPENIFLKAHSCVLGDFGLMKVAVPRADEDREILKESLGAGMPFRYRTPDLVAYLCAGPPPTCKSDVYQLGLVVAELFTGRNPQRVCNEFTDPVELEPLGSVPGALAPEISNLITRMLEPEAEKRDPAAKFIDPWQGVFFTAAKRAHALEGKVF
jgi:serine/threonine protein kinase